MESSAKRTALVAVDLGAQSCRVSLLRWEKGHPKINVMYRFPNGPVATQQGLRCDIGRIFDAIMRGLRFCAGAAPEGTAPVGLEGWAVGHVALDANAGATAEASCYRH